MRSISGLVGESETRCASAVFGYLSLNFKLALKIHVSNLKGLQKPTRLPLAIPLQFLRTFGKTGLTVVFFKQLLLLQKCLHAVRSAEEHPPVSQFYPREPDSVRQRAVAGKTVGRFGTVLIGGEGFH